MDKAQFKKEQDYLQLTQSTLLDKIHLSDALSQQLSAELEHENTAYFKSMRQMNLHSLKEETANELANYQKILDTLLEQQQETKKLKKIYKKMYTNPYFARIDLDIADELEKYYIGIHTLGNTNNSGFLVLDWRSPIAALFYDYDVGDALIETETKKTPCKLLNKRQYKIENGKLEYFFNTDVTINDDILKATLAKHTSVKMKAIVRTIQKEQNAIIRNSTSQNLIVQGIAGSGKTSIALHRIAYLLYKNRGKIKSHNVALLSPNKAFSFYISSVLPDLAEDDIVKYQLDEIMKKELRKFATVEDKTEQIERLINKNDDMADYNFKVSSECFYLIEKFAKEHISDKFDAPDIKLNDIVIDGDKINKLFHETYANKDVFTRMLWISEFIIAEYYYNVKSKKRITKIKGILLRHLYGILQNKDALKLYEDFLHTLHKELVYINGKLKNEDGYLLLFLKFFIYGYDEHKTIKYLVVDEMQDYSAVQLRIINMLFDCKKILLGDFKQSINPAFGIDSIQFLTKELKDVDVISLNTSFRPTVEIANLFNYFGGVSNSKVVSRKGSPPKLLTVDDKSIINITINEINNLKTYNTVAIIAKTKKQAQLLYTRLKNKIPVQLIDNTSAAYTNAVSILSAYTSKGLEFDAVIVYDVSAENYKTKIDENLLYIALSRPLHHISLISNGQLNDKLNGYFTLQNS